MPRKSRFRQVRHEVAATPAGRVDHRGADLLLTRKDVDSKRLAYVGHSYNATVGGFLSGCDHRFKALVLMASGLSDEVD